MRSHKFINSLLYLIIQLVAEESKANENNGGIRCFFVLFIDKHLISQELPCISAVKREKIDEIILSC